MAPPLNLVLVNSKSNGNFSDSHRRLIAKIAPVCFAYNFHLILVNLIVLLAYLIINQNYMEKNLTYGKNLTISMCL